MNEHKDPKQNTDRNETEAPATAQTGQPSREEAFLGRREKAAILLSSLALIPGVMIGKDLATSGEKTSHGDPIGLARKTFARDLKLAETGQGKLQTTIESVPVGSDKVVHPFIFNEGNGKNTNTVLAYIDTPSAPISKLSPQSLANEANYIELGKLQQPIPTLPVEVNDGNFSVTISQPNETITNGGQSIAMGSSGGFAVGVAQPRSTVN